MSSTIQFTPEEIKALHDKFREIKHDIANSLAVVMALSELAERNPVHYEKLAKTVLTRGPDIITKLLDFQRQLGEKLVEAPVALR